MFWFLWYRHPVQTVSLLVAAVWEASEDRYNASEVRSIVKAMCSVLGKWIWAAISRSHVVYGAEQPVLGTTDGWVK